VDEIVAEDLYPEVVKGCILKEGVAKVWMQRRIDFEGNQIYGVKVQFAGYPPLQKRGGQRPYARTGVQQPAVAALVGKERGHKNGDALRCQELAKP